MKVRVLEADSSKVRVHWAENKEFAQLYNGASTCPAHLEPYLCKVMAKATGVLPAKFTQVHEEVGIFTKQEMQHCKQHIAFNKMLAEAYPATKPLKAKYAADYTGFLKTKSLKFNVAYSEGFEAMSAIPTTAFFEESTELWAKADPQAEALWKWHLAEEYEHRMVMHDLYHAMYGHGWGAYFYRIYALFYATRHILKHVSSVSEILLTKEREGMSSEELAASKARESKIKKLAGRQATAHMRKILSPWYDPSKRVPPAGVMEILADNKAPVPIARSVAWAA